MIFVSYSSKEKSRARDVKKLLEASYFSSVFLAHEDIEATAIWRRETLKHLRRASAFIGCISSSFNDSPWCNQELGFAMARRIPILLVRVGSAKPVGFGAAKQATTVDNVVKVISTNKLFSPVRIRAWIDSTKDVNSYAAANSVFKMFSSEWDEMKVNERLTWIDVAASNGQVAYEGFQVGPFLKRKVLEMRSEMTPEWLESHKQCEKLLEYYDNE